MTIQFDLPEPAATLPAAGLWVISSNIRAPSLSADAICRSMITDLLIDDVLAHSAHAGQSSLTMQ